MSQKKLSTEEREGMQRDALRAFTRHYPRTSADIANRVHGYHYTKYIMSYIYHMKSLLNRIMPEEEQETLHYPEGEQYKITDEVVRMYSGQTSFNSILPETNDYHAKIMALEDSKKIFTLEEDLNLPELPKTIVPFEIANKTIINNPDKIAVINCPCREVKGEDGCYPRDVCLVIGEPWASFAVAYGEDVDAHFVTQEEALKIVEQSHKAGLVQALFWKESQNNQTYAMCNCCGCCCTAMQAYTYAASPMFSGSGYKAEIDEDNCIDCGTCAEVCKFGALSCDSGMLEYDEEKCMGCGVCEGFCDQEAISMRRDDPSVCEPLDLDVLIPKYTPEEAQE